MICLGIEALGQGASLEDVIAAAGGKDMKKSYREAIVEAFTAYQEQAQEEKRIERDEQRGIEEIKKICAETRTEAISLDKVRNIPHSPSDQPLTGYDRSFVRRNASSARTSTNWHRKC